jgi:hypothetical protein
LENQCKNGLFGFILLPLFPSQFPQHLVLGMTVVVGGFFEGESSA